MKLYTKEMFLIAAKKCEISMIDSKHVIKYIDEYVTPIELPSDEEIELIALDFAKKYRATTYEISALIIGAKWMRDKIQGGNNGHI
jgi:elongation factor P hydroxylase